MADEDEATARHRELLQELAERKMEELDAVLEMSAEAGFTPRQSLARTPPTCFSTPLTLPMTPAQPQAHKRVLTSPDEVQEALRRKVSGRRQEKGVAPPVSGITAGAPGAVPKSPARPGVVPPPPPVSGGPAAKELFPEEETDPLAAATVPQLVSIATSSTRGIMEAVRAKSSRLNKEEVAAMGAYTERLAAVVTHLTLRLAEAEKRTIEMVRDPILVAPMSMPATSYADKLRMGRRSVPKPATPCQTLAVYPAEKDGQLQTAEDTKAVIKRSIDPKALGIQVAGVRRVGNAGVIIQTTSSDAASKIKEALPPTVRVTEPLQRRPLVAIVNVEGEYSGDQLTAAIHAQNLAAADQHGLEAFRKECRLAFKKRRLGGARTTYVLECSPAVRDTLVARERVFVEWERYLVRDYLDVTCCLKCQAYGHPAKHCRATVDTCSACTEQGHRKADCPKQATDIMRCATCRGAGKPFEGHCTMSQDCPARRYAERKAIGRVNYHV